jgi:hypothetical protein
LQRSEQKVAFEGAKRQKVTKLNTNYMRARRAAIFRLFTPQVGLLSASLKKTQSLLHSVWILGEGLAPSQSAKFCTGRRIVLE